MPALPCRLFGKRGEAVRRNPDYDDLDLRISRGEAQEYTVGIIRSTQGENEFPSVLSIQPSSEPQNTWLAHWSRGWITPAELEALGRWLMGCMLPEGQVRSLYEKSRGGDHGLRIRLRLPNSELQALPWEAAFDDRLGDYLGLDQSTSLVRYLELPVSSRLEPGGEQIRILTLVSISPDQPSLQVVAEVQNLLRSLDDLLADNRAKVDFLVSAAGTGRAEIESLLAGQPGSVLLPGNASLTRLQEALREDYWILHYIGHGSYSEDTGGSIILSTEDGLSDEVDAVTFSRQLRNSNVSIVILNSCSTAMQDRTGEFRGVAQRLVQAGLPAVVAMQSLITDSNAIAFSRALFGAIANGYSLDSAVTEGRVAIVATRTGVAGEFAIPVLYLRSSETVVWKKRSGTQEASSPDLTKDARAGIIFQGDPNIYGPVIPGTVKGNVNYEYHAAPKGRTQKDSQKKPGEQDRGDADREETDLEPK